MTIDARRRVLRHAVTELILFETELDLTLKREQQAVRGCPDAAGAIERLAPTVQEQRDRLAAYIKSLGPDSTGEAPFAGFTFSSAGTVSGTLRQISVALNHGAVSYGMLYEMALRLYEPPLREIAPKHLKAYADAALAVNRLVPAVVAWELSQNALRCSCICPMCGLGACACIALGTQTLVAAWREGESSSPDFTFQPPKPDSELARVGVLGGERLLAIDGQEVRALPEAQAALRKHALGEEVRFLVQRGSEPPREVTVRHMSDYPKT